MAHNQRHHRNNQSSGRLRALFLVQRHRHLWPHRLLPMDDRRDLAAARQDTARMHAKSASLHRLRIAEQAAIWMLIGAGFATRLAAGSFGFLPFRGYSGSGS